jgi:hypothetical protein
LVSACPEQILADATNHLLVFPLLALLGLTTLIVLNDIEFFSWWSVEFKVLS